MTPALALLFLALTGCTGAPTYLHTFGAPGDREAGLGWMLLLVALAVVLVVAALVLAAAARRRGDGGGLMRGGGGIRWIIIGGVVLPCAILVVVFAVAMKTLAATTTPPAAPALTVEVIGHRWWWEVRYPGSSPADRFITANEIHIPTGRPVRLVLATADVIHSFWIPQLAGKTDLIPGQRNVAWIEADSAGTYWGHCGEYCGLQHANMMTFVTAESPDRFAVWLEGQRAAAAAPPDPVAASGEAVFQRAACALCHTIRGTGAGGALGPDLTHLASRQTIAAGALPNNRGNLAGWVANPQAIKPGVIMPAVPLSSSELNAIITYLQTLK